MFAALASVDAITQITRYLDLAGVLACAILGGAVARTEKLDLFGFLVVGIVSGLGGGIIRDTLLQHGTPVALTDYAYVPTAVVGALIAFVISISERAWNQLFIALDAAVILNVRTYDTAVRQQVLAAIERIVRAEAQGADAPKEPEFEILSAFPPTINDQEATDTVARHSAPHSPTGASAASPPTFTPPRRRRAPSPRTSRSTTAPPSPP